jgi:gamma-glutamyltranspeptidase/glutathione hydrolase
VLHAILALERGTEPAYWVTQPRFHHQYLPDRIQFEPDALGQQVQADLAAMGHRLEPLDRPYGNLQAVYWDRVSNRVSAASDPRGIGEARVGN